MSRFDNLISIEKNKYLSKLFDKLKKQEREMLLDFVMENDHLSKDEYAHKANRWFIDQKIKPKNHVDMWAIATQLED